MNASELINAALRINVRADDATARSREQIGENYLHVRLSRDGHAVSGSGSVLLGHQIRSASADEPDGVFVRWSWDGERVTVRNDRHGLYPCFYYANDSEICLSPSIPRILRRVSPCTIDDEALAVFLRLGYFLAEDTAFREIRALPPDARLQWHDGKLELTGHRRLIPPLNIDRREAITTYQRLFQQAIARRASGASGFVVPLSGGCDSRHILAELCEQARKPEYVVTVNYDSREVVSAAQVARRLGVSHLVLGVDAKTVEAEQLKNLATSFCAIEHSWLMSLRRHLAGYETIFDGLAGDVLSAGLFSTPERRQLLETRDLEGLAATFFWNDHKNEILDRIIPASQRPRFAVRVARRRLVAELRRYGDAANPLASFFFYNRTRRCVATAPFGVLQPVETVYCPFVDHALFDFLSSLPASMTSDHQFHLDTFRQAYPALADIPYAGKAPQRLRRSLQECRNGWSLWKYLRNRPDNELIDRHWIERRSRWCMLTGSTTSQLSVQYGVLLTQIGEFAASSGASCDESR